MSDEQNPDARPGRLTRFLARLRRDHQQARPRRTGRLSLAEAAERAAADLEGW
ncbi:hypothetical protein ACWD48_14465 [Streptomyces sp. NPDC002519]